MKRALQQAEEINHLADRLNDFDFVRRYSTMKENHAGSLAHALGDFEAAFSVILDKHLPVLLRQSLTEQEAKEALLNIREELRPIYYHIKNNDFFNVIVDQGQ